MRVNRICWPCRRKFSLSNELLWAIPRGLAFIQCADQAPAERMCCMIRFSSFSSLVVLGGAALLAVPLAGAQSDPLAGSQTSVSADIASGGPSGLGNVLPPLPALPPGRTTVIGGV